MKICLFLCLKYRSIYLLKFFTSEQVLLINTILLVGSYIKSVKVILELRKKSRVPHFTFFVPHLESWVLTTLFPPWNSSSCSIKWRISSLSRKSFKFIRMCLLDNRWEMFPCLMLIVPFIHRESSSLNTPNWTSKRSPRHSSSGYLINRIPIRSCQGETSFFVWICRHPCRSNRNAKFWRILRWCIFSTENQRWTRQCQKAKFFSLVNLSRDSISHVSQWEDLGLSYGWSWQWWDSLSRRMCHWKRRSILSWSSQMLLQFSVPHQHERRYNEEREMDIGDMEVFVKIIVIFDVQFFCLGDLLICIRMLYWEWWVNLNFLVEPSLNLGLIHIHSSLSLEDFLNRDEAFAGPQIGFLEELVQWLNGIRLKMKRRTSS